MPNVTRTAKFIGAAFAESGNATVTLSYNGTQVFSGTVSTRPEAELDGAVRDELFTFNTNTSVTGDVPVTLTVTGGTLYWADILMNYVDQTDEIAPADLYTSPYEIDESGVKDGKKSVAIDGESVVIDRTEGTKGQWPYKVTEGQTLTANFYVDPSYYRGFDPNS